MIKSFSENHREITDYLCSPRKSCGFAKLCHTRNRTSRFLLLLLNLAATNVERIETKILAKNLQQFGTQIAVGYFSGVAWACTDCPSSCLPSTVVLQAFCCCIFTDCGKFLQSLLVNHDGFKQVVKWCGKPLQRHSAEAARLHRLVYNPFPSDSAIVAVWEPAAPISLGWCFMPHFSCRWFCLPGFKP